MDRLLVQTHSATAAPRRLRKAISVPSWSEALSTNRDPKTRTKGVVGTVSRTITGANHLWLSWKDGLTPDEREEAQAREERKQILCQRMRNAETLKQWQGAAEELDVLEGNDVWKQEDASRDYNPALIEERLRALDEARSSCDIRSMMHLIRTALSRDLGGMDNVDLYRHSYVGTKKLIERYVESTIQTIDAVVAQSATGQGVEYRDLLESMLFSRQSFGRSALLLSGGGTFGMTHIGVLKALFDAQLLPRIISGASAGSIVCAVMCTRTDEEMPALINEFPYGDLAVFGAVDTKTSVLNHVRQLLTEGSWSDIQHLTRVMKNLTGDLTFQEAYNRTRRILNICVSTASIYELPRLLNYVTAPNVIIWSAVAASCSLPLVFTSSPLLVKDPVTGEHIPWNPTPQRFIDGSVDNDLPMTRLSEMFNVNHFIVSQVNPHVVPFLSKDDHLSPDDKKAKSHAKSQDDFDWMSTFTTLARDEALHRLQFMAEMGILPNLMTKFQTILSQKYSGDITILPEIDMFDLPRLLSNPTIDFMLRSCLLGERATWPKLSRIRDRCAIELALDRAVHNLRTRVVFSESQRDLRTLNSGITNNQAHLPAPISTQSSAIGQAPPGGLEIKRQRRRSGGSLQTIVSGKFTLEPNIEGDESTDEERAELELSGQGRGGASFVPRKPRLKRASKSHIHVPQHRTSLTPSAPVEELFGNFGFDSTKQEIPRPSRDALSPTRVGNAAYLSAENIYDQNYPDSWPDDDDTSTGHTTSLTEDQDTSEPGQPSDTETELATEESDPETLDEILGSSPPAKYTFRDDDWDSFSQTRYVNGCLWD